MIRLLVTVLGNIIKCMKSNNTKRWLPAGYKIGVGELGLFSKGNCNNHRS